MPKLKVHFAALPQPLDVELGQEEVTLGKNPEKNTLVIADNRISREHARIYRSGDAYFLEDRGSKNGTFLNGRRLAAGEAHRLIHGYAISLANACRITFLEFDQPSTEVIQFAERPLGETVMFRAPGQVSGETRRLDLASLAAATPQSIVEEILRLQKQVEKQAQRLSLLYQLGQALSSVFSLDEIFRQATSILFEVTPADRCCILLKDEKSTSLNPALIRARKEGGIESGQTLLISETVVRRVVEEKVALASFYAQADQTLQEADSIKIQGIQSVMCSPLIGREGVLGVIYADRQNPRETFTEDDLELLNAIAGGTAVALDNARSYERLSREALARAAYGRFMPQHVVEQILASPDSLRPGGSNQVATVLFADIRGFTPLSECARPEEVVRLLNTYFQAMTDIIFAHGGTLDKYIGDGLMALFGAPYSSDEDAANAVCAAIAMQQRVINLVEELQRLNLPEIGIGIGINTGEVTVGYIGSTQRLDYTAIGDTVNLAARLESKATRGQILISESTRLAIGDRFSASPIGTIQVKGRVTPVQVYEVSWQAVDWGRSTMPVDERP